MKKYLFVIVPMCKWFANTLMVILVFSYIYTNPISPWVDLAIGWTLSGFLVAPFAYWAFHKKLPTDKQLGIFILCWVLITILMETLITLATWPISLVTVVLIRYEFFVQIIIEILVILLIARVLRRQRAYHETVEGIDVA